MTRTDFTINIVGLLHEMIFLGEKPIIDYVKRSDEEQARLFKKKLSKCDGYNILSKHQLGQAMDIYFVVDGKLTDPKLGWEHWHEVWEHHGGKPMIEWDKGHFE